MNETDLKAAIDQLTDKQHVLSEKAVQIKSDLEAGVPCFTSGLSAVEQKKQLWALEEFSKSMRVLNALFKYSSFDELVLLIAQPVRLMVLSFFIGLIRGLGFTCGVLMIVGLFLYFFQDINLVVLVQSLLGL